MKIKKNRQRKRYRYGVNRKALNKTRSSTGKIKDPVLKKVWENTKRPGKNYREMGLSTDPNKTVPIINTKQERLQIIKLVNEVEDEDMNETAAAATEKPKPAKRRPKAWVAEKLERDANELVLPELKLPKGHVQTLCYFMDKYKLNYKAMVRDRKNLEQWTWKQFRAKIRKLMSIPEQFNPYLEKHNLPVGEKLPWVEYDSDSEW